MKINKRVLIESIIFSTIIVLAVLGWRIVRGYFLTQNFVPEIINSYDSIDYLQHKVSFGIVNRNYWITAIIGIGGFVVLFITYYWIRTWLTQIINRKKR